jgi:hypothetical protein
MNQLNLQLNTARRPTKQTINTVTLGMIVVSAIIFIAGVLAGIYALAASLAIAMASNFNVAETTRYQNVIAFESALMRASNAQRVASVKCDLADANYRQQCHAQSIAEQRRATRAASVDVKTPSPSMVLVRNDPI